MPRHIQLNKPWLVAVWPGMGHVALSAGYYLMSKLGMHAVAEFAPRELFDAEYADVSGGLIRLGEWPRSQFFIARDPSGTKHDIVLFIGEAQPASGKYAFCQRLIECAENLGIERVFTFASMATPMHPEQPSRVFAAATDRSTLAEIERQDVERLSEGQIGGLNGLLLGVAAEHGMHGACLLGEIPQIFAPLPSPKAALAVLETFTSAADIQIDFSELQEQAADVNETLKGLLAQLEEAVEGRGFVPNDDAENDVDETVEAPASTKEERQLTADEQQRIGLLFEQAKRDRSKAYELKRELDRLDVFARFEDRFLDLFAKPDSAVFTTNSDCSARVMPADPRGKQDELGSSER